MCSFTKDTLQPWNSLQHTTFLQYYKKNLKNLQLWNEEEWRYYSVFFMLLFERFYYKIHTIISQIWSSSFLHNSVFWKTTKRPWKLAIKKSSFSLNFTALSRENCITAGRWHTRDETEGQRCFFIKLSPFPIEGYRLQRLFLINKAQVWCYSVFLWIMSAAAKALKKNET